MVMALIQIGLTNIQKFRGFRSWFVLQHSKRYCKRPFVTIVNFEESINGTY